MVGYLEITLACHLNTHAFFSYRVPVISAKEMVRPIPMFWVGYVELAPQADGQMLKLISLRERANIKYAKLICLTLSPATSDLR